MNLLIFLRSLNAHCNQHCTFMFIVNYFIDAHILLQANISRKLTFHKDFASDKKIAKLFSYNALSRIALDIEEGVLKAYVSDVGVLFSTFFMMKLHLHAVNPHVPAKNLVMCLFVTMMWFTSVTGISLMPKRNIMLKTIGNAFLGLKSEIAMLRHTTSESCEHASGNTLQGKR